jgi:hypothetical protein
LLLTFAHTSLVLGIGLHFKTIFIQTWQHGPHIGSLVFTLVAWF